ncbi:MAG TPA: hypothetical protein VIY96_10690, partial [Thermoanaerobaculia bacterium]
MNRPVLTPADVGRAFEAARDAMRTDRTRTRAALVALAIAMAIVVCLTALVERGRAATIRSLQQAGLANLYLVHHASVGGSEAASPRMTSADAERISRLTRALSSLVIRVDRRSVTAAGRAATVPVYAVAGPSAKVFGMRARTGRLLG